MHTKVSILLVCCYIWKLKITFVLFCIFSADPKIVKELKKKFKVKQGCASYIKKIEGHYGSFFLFDKRFLVPQYEGSLQALYTMMVNPNGIIKKPGAKDLNVNRGEVLDVIQIGSNKKALCRNQYGKCVFSSLFLSLSLHYQACKRFCA